MFLHTYVSFDVLKVTKTSSGLFKQKRNVLKKYVFAHRITVLVPVLQEADTKTRLKVQEFY